MNDQFEKIIIKGINLNASDIHINLNKTCEITYRIQGCLSNKFSIPLNQGSTLINLIKFSSNIDINYRLKPQTGHFHFFYNNKNYNFRVSSLPNEYSESIVIRVLNNTKELNLSNITNIEHINQFLKSITKYENGLFLISGATGSGKSTTLYAMLDYINDNYNYNIITLEDPIEINKLYCNQIQINNEMGITYESVLRQVLRHDPDIIMIGEIRDYETAKLAITASLTGHLVLATIHANNAITTITRMCDLGINRIDLYDVLLGVVNQKILNRNKQLVLMEYMNKIQIDDYVNRNFINYYDFKKAEFELNNQSLNFKNE